MGGELLGETQIERRNGHTWVQVKCLQSISSDRPTSWRESSITCSVADTNTCTIHTDIQNITYPYVNKTRAVAVQYTLNIQYEKS